MSNDRKIADTLKKFGEEFRDAVWRVQGTAVIYHKALERIAAQAKIQFDAPTIVRAERDEAVILVTGRMADRMEWSIGEALVGANYRVSGKQAAYVWAMAEKRAKDRVILKLIELHGMVYSEAEADEFKASRTGAESAEASEPGEEILEYLENTPASAPAAPDAPAAPGGKVVPIKPDAGMDESSIRFDADMRKKIDAAPTVAVVTDLMLGPNAQKMMPTMPEEPREALRAYAKARLAALGWPGVKAKA